LSRRYSLEHFELPVDDAIKMLEDVGEPYKLSFVGNMQIRVKRFRSLSQGFYSPLSRASSMSTGLVKAFKLTACTGVTGEATQLANRFPYLRHGIP
jgi:hypothetical protein